MAEVQFFGITPAPQNGGNREVEIFSPTLTPRAEFTEVVLFEPPSRQVRSENPNINDVLLFVSGGPTTGAQAINVLMVPAPVPLGDGTILQQGPAPRDLRLFPGPLSPLGVVGKIVVFVQPTGASMFSPLLGVTGMIASVGDPTGLSDGSVPTAACSISFVDPLPAQPTLGDRLVIVSDDRSLRRTPIVEVFLE